jgi:alpha-1,3-rhamnosyltransferase
MSDPLISVLIPAYNHESFIEEAVRSVWEQSYKNVEIVAVDDGSADGTWMILEGLQKESPLRMVIERNRENSGINRTLNRALALSSGPYIAILASDDKFAANRFESQVSLLEADPDLMIVYGNGRCLLPDGTLGERVHPEETQALLSMPFDVILDRLYTRVTPLFTQSTLMRRSFLLVIGGFDEELINDDWVLNIRIFQKLAGSGRHAYMDEDLFLYRLHERNVHKNFDRQSQAIIEVVEKYTPRSLRRQTLAQIYWERGLRAMNTGSPSAGLRYLTISQWHRLRLKQYLLILLSHKRFLLKFLLPSTFVDSLGDRLRSFKASR